MNLIVETVDEIDYKKDDLVKTFAKQKNVEIIQI